MDITHSAPVRRTLCLAAALALATPAAAQDGPRQPLRPVQPIRRASIAPASADVRLSTPTELAAWAPPASAVVLRAGETAATVQSLGATHARTLANLRTEPVVRLGRAQVDMTPFLANPKALPNIAERLRARPQLAEVTADTTQAYEIPQGLVVQSVLGYRLRPGACSDSSRRAQLAETGLHCFSRQEPGNRAAAFADPHDAHYVADPRQRAIALTRANQQEARIRAEVAQDIKTLRASLADPAQRAAIAAEIGEADAARLATLDDAALGQEVVNTAETRIEQVMFVPSNGRVDPARFPKLAQFGAVRDAKSAFLPLAVNGTAGATPIAAQLPPAEPPPPTNLPLQSQTFLTGFTLGREYEWRQRVETSIKWCLVGCKKTYYAELYAGFGYGFGLRFPVRLDGTYHREGKSATLTPVFNPIDGSAADYAATGLSGSQVFEGKELVAEFNAWAGAGYKVPFLGSGGVRVDVGKDFTDWLPAPLTHGQFTPPAAGANLPVAPMIFDSVDLIGGQANFGVAGGQVFPALKIDLHSDALRLNLHDDVAGVDRPLASGVPVPLKVDATYASRFSIGDPVYNLGFLLTPGIDARLFIDVSVWSASWDWPVWFPQLAVQLPPDGIDFACHADTECNRAYVMTPKGVLSGESAIVLGQLDEWASGFDGEWLPQCTDDICRTGIRLVRLNAVLLGKQALDAAPKTGWDALQSIRDQAGSTAKKLVQESHQRLTANASQGWAMLSQAVWSKRCMDVACLDDVAKLADSMVQAAVDRQKSEPEESSLHVQGEVNREFGAKFQSVIDASKARAEAKPIAFKPIVLKTR